VQGCERSRELDQQTYDKGLEIRSAVLGGAYVNKALADADDFTEPLQDLVTEYCWGAVWGRDGLALKTRTCSIWR
jgi:4-carboxymuconolactone decarboxylase